MSLTTYRRKRDFGKTPEPSDGELPSSAPAGDHRFVVQRHRATRLHYDFRLEIDGVLMSWAVPRGPSLNPAERRMAVHVEDHPLSYFDFEGVIPKGEYGGGDVIVWDWGTWRPEETDDPGKAVASGELKFKLHGDKLKGRFTLVKTRGYNGGQDDWLLIHKRDDDADPSWDVDKLPRSVKTGRTNDEVLAGADAVWDSNAPPDEAAIDLAGAKKRPLPDFIEPMKATTVDKPFDDDDWLFELKLDGYRIEAVVNKGRVKLWTRNKLDAARYFPDLASAAPTWIRADTAIVDGEVVALDEDGVPQFSLLQDRAGMGRFGPRGVETGSRKAKRDPNFIAPVVYFAFDIIYHDGRLLVDVPLEERKKLLRSVLRDSDRVRYSSHIVRDGNDFYDAVRKQGLEGLVAKLRTSVYEPGRRSKSWLKVKIRREQEVVIVGYEPGQGTHSDIGSLILGVYEGKDLRYVGEVGSGINTKMRAELKKELDAHAVDQPPVVNAPRIKGARWSEPLLVARVEFSEWTDDDFLRQAAFKGMDIGKDPRKVVREREVSASEAVDEAEASQKASPRSTTRSTARSTAKSTAKPTPAKRRTARPKAGEGPFLEDPDDRSVPPQAATSDEMAALEALGKEGMWDIGGHTIALSNLDKVLFPEPGFTKRDLIRYYVTISPVMLPYLRDRPLNLWRWPDGVTGKSFWQKQVPSYTPDWVQRWDYPEAGSSESHTYIVADRVATMAWLANHATIDMHPWTSTVADYLHPTYALIDIDPGTSTTFDEVVTLAKLYRAALDHLGVKARPKVTGKRGIQIWVPVEPQYSYRETSAWVEAVSRAVGAAVPSLVSWEWAKSSRRGLARLDFTQNAVNKTLVAPYAVRPVSNAGVSAPIEWEELDDPNLRPDGWDIRTLLDRVRDRGDLFRPILETPQELPAVD
jgi:bifunctional non-homologous end joining protein LigD